jgi:uncharacterized protein
MTHLPGKFVWFEVVTTDVARAKAFYSELIGWDLNPIDMGGFTYEMINNQQQGVGGIVQAPEGVPSHWISYLSVPDVDAKSASIVKAGGKVQGEAMTVPNVGRMVRVSDPLGSAFMLFHAQDGDKADAPGVLGGFHWNELWTTDTKQALSFYKEQFGFQHDVMNMGPQGDYFVLKTGETQRAGLMKSPETKIPSMWLPYIHVSKIDETTKRAVSMGAKILKEASDIPGVGRFSILADPTGAVIGLITPQAQG